MRTSLFTLYIFIFFMILPKPCKSELIMHTHGHITITPFIHGYDTSSQLYPGYRSEFMTYVDFFKYRGVVFNSLLSTTTMINKPENKKMRMDRVRYTLTPGFRYDFNNWLVKGALHHECIHVISRPELKGSVWWNSMQIGIGTKGAYYLYLPEYYKNLKNTFLNSWDAQLNIGYIIPAKNTLATGQNHDYRFELFSLVRYQLGTFGRYVYFAALRQQFWIKSDDSMEHQINITLNVFLKGTVNFTGIYYNYTIYDTFSLDNTDGMGSLGFKILF